MEGGPLSVRINTGRCVLALSCADLSGRSSVEAPLGALRGGPFSCLLLHLLSYRIITVDSSWLRDGAAPDWGGVNDASMVQDHLS